MIICIITISLLHSSCINIWNKTIHGDGKMTTETRNVTDARNLHSSGNFDVEIVQGTPASVKIDADENLMPYIITEYKDNALNLRTKDKVNLSSDNKIKVYITTDKLESIDVAGSGDVVGDGLFSGSDKIDLSIEGTGNITLQVNTPTISSSIAGTGDINLSGETKDSRVEIDGIGDYKAEDLKAENADIHIAGSGNAKVFASASLNVEIAGTGDVYYHGTPNITQNVAGTGTIKQLP